MDRQRAAKPVALDVEAQELVGRVELEVDRVAQRVAVDGQDAVAGAQPCRRRRAPGRTAATTTPGAVASFGVQPLMRLLALGVLGGVEEAHALHEVLQAGDERESRGDPQERRRHATHAHVAARRRRGTR